MRRYAETEAPADSPPAGFRLCFCPRLLPDPEYQAQDPGQQARAPDNNDFQRYIPPVA